MSLKHPTRDVPLRPLALSLLIASLFVLVHPGLARLEAQETVTFPASDGETLHGVWYRTSAERSTAIIVAFHQAGANGIAEYGPIAPTLNEAGYDVLAVDQRSGGSRLGGVNRTAEALGQEVAYCDVMPDLEGALDFVRRQAGETPIVIWGSSYSAALVLRLAASNPAGLAGVLAFSPASGGPMAACRGEEVSDRIRVPVLALRPSGEMNLESSARQFTRFAEQGHETFVAQPGTHGSSMLVEDRVGASVEDTWSAVLDFLARATR